MTTTATGSPTPAKIRVVIADDHHIVRMGLRALLDAHPRIDVVGEASNGTETWDHAIRSQPDVLLVDMRMPGLDGIEICRRAKALADPPAVLFLTSYADEDITRAAVAAGADGYLLKSFSGQDIPEAILKVAEGSFLIDPTLAEIAIRATEELGLPPQRVETLRESLSVQEKRALALAAQCLSHREIGAAMDLSEGTVRNYLSNVYGKLGVKNKPEAILWWLRQQGSAKAR